MSLLFACIDDSRYTRGVLDHTAWAASRLQAKVGLVHVIRHYADNFRHMSFSANIGDSNRKLMQALSTMDQRRTELVHEQAGALLDAATAHLVQQGVKRTFIKPYLRSGELVDVFVKQLSGASMSVIGKRGTNAGAAQRHLGSNLGRVLRGAKKPVLVTPQVFKPIQRMLLAFDNSDNARKAVELVANSPLTRDLACDVVMVGKDNATTRNQLEWAQKTLERGHMQVKAHMLSGNAEEVIPEYVATNHIDLLALGAYAHSRIRGLVLGNTTGVLIRHCECPVLVVR